MDTFISVLRRSRFLRRIAAIPAISFPYHFLLGFLGAMWYGFPSRKLVVIGVTGTKGKTTTSNLIWQVLQRAGHKTGLATTVNFRIGDLEFTNQSKQTMLGRFELQRLLREMVDAGCTHAVIETSSWGIAQYRHRFVNYAVAVITNLTPEHIEQHGGFEKYRAAKVGLFAHVARLKHGIGIYNLDDKNLISFLGPAMPKKFGYSLQNKEMKTQKFEETICVTNVQLLKEKSTFSVGGTKFSVPLTGEFNVYNAGAAIAVGRSQGIALSAMAESLKQAAKIAGRMEIIQKKNKPTVIIDYAHEPASLEAVYTAARIFRPKRMIAILGSQGGGRDIWKRDTMGRVAAKYLDVVILTNEDPYDEDPLRIMEDIERGVVVARRGANPDIYKVIDRKEAIQKAIAMATPEDIVLLTGKGGEVWMCVADERKIPWDERAIVEEALKDASVLKREKKRNDFTK